jgi:hypothetical protein
MTSWATHDDDDADVLAAARQGARFSIVPA